MKKGVHFSAKGVAKMYGCRAAKKEKIGEIFQSWMPSTFVKGSCFGTPLYTTCKSNEGGDKHPSLRKKGRSWYEGKGGGGGTDTRRKGLM